MKVTVQEIVSLIEGFIESDACMGSISDKQVIMSLEVVSRIKQHGIAPPDGWVLVPKKPTDEMVKQGAIGGETAYAPADAIAVEWLWAAMLDAAPDVKLSLPLPYTFVRDLS